MTGNRMMVDEVVEQYRRAYEMLYAVVDKIPADRWTSGLTEACVPARIAYHTVESLDFYFSGKPGSEFQFGHKFGGYWADLPPERLPTKEELLAYAQETEVKVGEFLGEMDDENLSAPIKLYDWVGKTKLGHLVYALRHTMHHQGELAALQVYSGVEGDSWK